MGPGAEEFGPYLVYEQLGYGGMATVHRAETKGIAGFTKQVALKRMLPSVAADASLVKSFIREARLASQLRHANVATTYELGKVGDIYFIAMELVPGRTLREILKHCAAVVGHMPLPIAMNIVSQIADALDYAHDLCDDSGRPLGIVHRDVSPSNVIVSEGGVVKLIDFGIAKGSNQSDHGTQSGTIKGKFAYMAPEYLLGSLDARADLFALGVIAHELLANRPLFQGRDDMDTLFRVKDMPILPPSRINPAVPPELDAVIMTALERDPDKRWQHANALRQALATEARRLDLVAHNGQVLEWVDAAFDDAEPAISITREVPDEFSSSDGHETLIKQTKAPPRTDDWNVLTDPTAPAADAIAPLAPIDHRGDATRLVRKSAQQIATADPLLDTRRDHAGPTGRTSSPHIIARKTPVPTRVTPAPTHNTPVPTRTTPVPTHTTPAPTRTTPDPTRNTPIPRAAPALADDDIDDLVRMLPARAERASQPPPVARAPRSDAAARTMIDADTQDAAATTPMPPQPQPPVIPSLIRTLPGATGAPPIAAPIAAPVAGGLLDMANSGARTAPHMRAQVNVDDLAARGERPSAASLLPPRAAPSAEPREPREHATVPSPVVRLTSNFLLAVLVLIAAGGAAAVVYFALPYLT